MILYCLLNVVLSAYILGTVTMLMVKFDERSKLIRDRKKNLDTFRQMHNLSDTLYSAMTEHLELHFSSEQTAEANVLSIYPATLRRKVMRQLYLPQLRGCYLFSTVDETFVNMLLAVARVELFMPNVELLQRGDVSQELCVIVDGEVVVACRPSVSDADNEEPGSSILAITARAKVRRGIHKFLLYTKDARQAGQDHVLEGYAKLVQHKAAGLVPEDACLPVDPRAAAMKQARDASAVAARFQGAAASGGAEPGQEVEPVSTMAMRLFACAPRAHTWRFRRRVQITCTQSVHCVRALCAHTWRVLVHHTQLHEAGASDSPGSSCTWPGARQLFQF
eukprot:365721-Chlamydomonas_euryale.AAC.2